jgi:hypothetical protein
MTGAVSAMTAPLPEAWASHLGNNKQFEGEARLPDNPRRRLTSELWMWTELHFNSRQMSGIRMYSTHPAKAAAH